MKLKNLAVVGLMSLVMLSATGCGYEQFITVNEDGTSEVTAKLLLKDIEIEQADATCEKEYGSSFTDLLTKSGLCYSGERVLDDTKYKVYSESKKQDATETDKMFVFKNDEQAVIDMNSDCFDFAQLRKDNGKDEVDKYEHFIYRFDYPQKIVNASIIAEDNTLTISKMDMLDKDLDRVYVTFKEGVSSRRDLKLSGVADKGCYNKVKTVSAKSSGVITKFRVNNEPLSKNSYKATKQGKYSILVELSSGVTKKLNFTIDKSKPTTNIKAKTYTKTAKITFKDKLSGIKKALLNGKIVKNNTKVSKSGSYTLSITDKAGNTNTVKFTLK